MLLARRKAERLDVGQGGCAVHAGLALAQEVEVGAVQNQYFFHRYILSACCFAFILLRR